jgi:outer membrane lipoprotein-sorting protein
MKMLSKRSILNKCAALAIVAITPAIVAAESRVIPLGEISSYFNDMTTANTMFAQINSDKTISSGNLNIDRPGKMRFDYNLPEKSRVIVSGGQLAIFDSRSNSQKPERYPLHMTPLNLILERNVNFASRDMVVDHFGDGIKTTLVVHDADHPERGTIELIFTDTPIELRQWVVIDSTGMETTIILSGIKEGMTIPSVDFNIQREIRKIEK